MKCKYCSGTGIISMYNLSNHNAITAFACQCVEGVQTNKDYGLEFWNGHKNQSIKYNNFEIHFSHETMKDVETGDLFEMKKNEL